MKRALFLSLMCVAVLGLGASSPASLALGYGTSGNLAGGVQPEAGLFSAGLPGQALSAPEASTILGGDVFMELNADRTRMRVKVYTNDDELRRLRPTPTKTFEVDVHNRIVDTTNAPYMPAAGYPVANGPNLTSRPSPFPEGTWNVTEIREIAGKYGPFMVMTDAIGNVEVFSNGVSQGWYRDSGYAAHSSSVDFERSQTFGCLQNRRSDIATIARELLSDRADSELSRGGGRPVQMFHVGGRF